MWKICIGSFISQSHHAAGTTSDKKCGLPRTYSALEGHARLLNEFALTDLNVRTNNSGVSREILKNSLKSLQICTISFRVFVQK